MKEPRRLLVLLLSCALAALVACGSQTFGDESDTARCFREQAEHFRQVGDPQAALIYDAKADQCDPVLIGYRSRPASEAELHKYYTAQKAEPYYGCYLGVHCFQDDRVDKCFSAFCNLTGKRHAMMFDYAKPGDMDAHMWDAGIPGGAWLQSAFEPGDLKSVRADDPELEHWAKALGAVRNPIFLRWASEMNGDWVDWGGNPKLFVEKWRIVHNIMARFAPNVVMVWCPNATPALNIDSYYPGDDYVDWVGVNFYVVPIHNNDPRSPARNENPADLFKHVYEKYASRKPLVICETGVSHLSQALVQPEYGFAVARLGQLYGCLPRLYPRVKAIFYYDVDNLKDAVNGRPFNNYLLTDNPQVLAAYQEAIKPDYFLTGAQSLTGPFPDYIEPLADGQTLRGVVTLSAWAKSLCIAPVVQYRLDGKLLGESRQCGAYPYKLDCSCVALGPHVIGVAMLDKCGGRVLKQVSYHINVADATPLLATAPGTPAPAATTPAPVPATLAATCPKGLDKGALKKRTSPEGEPAGPRQIKARLEALPK